VPFLDLAEASAREFQAMGPQKVQALFCGEKDLVHTNQYGAELNARLIAGAIGKWLSPGVKF
jgi:hypothetical protein